MRSCANASRIGVGDDRREAIRDAIAELRDRLVDLERALEAATVKRLTISLTPAEARAVIDAIHCFTNHRELPARSATTIRRIDERCLAVSARLLRGLEQQRQEGMQQQ